MRETLTDVRYAPIDCANSTMNDHMLKALKAEKNPVIECRLRSSDVARTAGAIKGQLERARGRLPNTH